ncbi:MAG: hypothetical protein SPI58_04905, partial [Candidatus Enteromonas sp.]|nr:hypothetical protein [Candidatus Enteromonas sp.]
SFVSADGVDGEKRRVRHTHIIPDFPRMGKMGKILECSILDGKKSFGHHKKTWDCSKVNDSPRLVPSSGGNMLN